MNEFVPSLEREKFVVLPLHLVEVDVEGQRYHPPSLACFWWLEPKWAALSTWARCSTSLLPSLEREKFAVILLPFEREDVEGQRLYPPGRIIGEIHTVTFRPDLPLAFGQEMNNVEYLGEVFNAVPTVPWRGEFAVTLLLFC